MGDRVDELRKQAVEVRVRAIESHKELIAELVEIWRELKDLADGRPEARKACEQVAADIARLEKVDLAFDTEWLAEAKRLHP